MNFIPDESGADLKQLFFESAQELLQALNEQGLELEQDARDPELARSVRRIVHTLKGDSAACGYSDISELAHHLEDVLTPELAERDAARLAELVLTAADVFSAMLAAYRNGTPVPDGKALRRLIERAAVGSQKTAAGHAKSSESTPFDWTEYEQRLIADRAGRGEQVLQLRLELDHTCPTPAAAYQLIRNALEQSGEILVIHAEANSGEALTVVEVALASKAKLKAIIRKCKIPAVVSEVNVVPYAAAANRGEIERNSAGAKAPDSFSHLHGTAKAVPLQNASEPTGTVSQNLMGPKGEAAAKNASLTPPATPENTLRVDAGRVDALLNLVGELIIGKSMLHQTLGEFGRRFPKDTLRGRFADAVAFQSRVLGELQKSVMKIRMVPVEQLFRRFPRVVRDVAKARGREVRLEISGEDTDLDKSILDVLAEPLNHLVRNAVDHGIESSAERAAAGKPEQGTIGLKAFHQGNQVVIEVSDDGRGIDGDKIRAKALQNKVIFAAQVARMSEAEALELIFHPGLSTAEEVTAISGRGVGMDVVKTVLERLKGTVQVKSRKGQGTSIYLKVPLTLAIINALLFRVEEKLYAVPLASVVEIMRAREEQIHVADLHEVMQLRDDVITLIRLGKLHSGNGNGAAQKLFVVVIRLGERKFGLVVDKVVGEEELVIKALGDQLVATDLISGASILGDGSVVLILNLAAVVARLGRSQSEDGELRPPAPNEVRA